VVGNDNVLEATIETAQITERKPRAAWHNQEVCKKPPTEAWFHSKDFVTVAPYCVQYDIRN